MSPPAPPACLNRPYCARLGQRGGTLIAEEVCTLAVHDARLCDPDAYRPDGCGHCQGLRLHAHDFRVRILRGGDERPAIFVRRYQCAECDAVWLVLPALVARHLHRSWNFVQAAMVTLGVLLASTRPRRRSVPTTTRRRWTQRLRSSASGLARVLAGGGADVDAGLVRLGLDGERASFVEALSHGGHLSSSSELEELAGWVHRLLPGVRVM